MTMAHSVTPGAGLLMSGDDPYAGVRFPSLDTAADVADYLRLTTPVSRSRLRPMTAPNLGQCHWACDQPAVRLVAIVGGATRGMTRVEQGVGMTRHVPLCEPHAVEVEGMLP